MKAPERLWLQEDGTWSDERIDDGDVPYLRQWTDLTDSALMGTLVLALTNDEGGPMVQAQRYLIAGILQGQTARLVEMAESLGAATDWRDKYEQILNDIADIHLPHADGPRGESGAMVSMTQGAFCVWARGTATAVLSGGDRQELPKQSKCADCGTDMPHGDTSALCEECLPF